MLIRKPAKKRTEQFSVQWEAYSKSQNLNELKVKVESLSLNGKWRLNIFYPLGNATRMSGTTTFSTNPKGNRVLHVHIRQAWYPGRNLTAALLSFLLTKSNSEKSQISTYNLNQHHTKHRLYMYSQFLIKPSYSIPNIK